MAAGLLCACRLQSGLTVGSTAPLTRTAETMPVAAPVTSASPTAPAPVPSPSQVGVASNSGAVVPVIQL